jgi:hypothetical protein
VSPAARVAARRPASLSAPAVAYRRARRRVHGQVRSIRSLATSGDRQLVRVERFALFVVVGYLVEWRSFAYIGIPSLNIFVGEVALGLAVLHPRTRQALYRAALVLTRPGRWHGLIVIITVFLVFGVIEVGSGVARGFNLLSALKGLPFNYYVVFVILGVWLGQQSRDLLQRFAWVFAVANAVYGLPAVLFLSKLSITFPGSRDVNGSGAPVPVFSVGTGSGMAVIALLAFPLPPKWRKFTVPLLLVNAFVMLAEQQRAEWLGFATGLLVWTILTRRVRTFLAGMLAVVGLLAVISLFGLKIPGAPGRGGQVSPSAVLGRILAPVDPNLASHLVPNSTLYAATASWRTTWWHAIWRSSQQDLPTAMLGHGYGYELRSLAPYVPPDTRTPHDVFFYALGYTGWVGVTLFGLLWFTLITKLYRVFRLTGNAFGLAFVAVAFGLGLFGNWFETPYGAAPTYLVVGLALAPLSTFAPAGARGLDPRRGFNGNGTGTRPTSKQLGGAFPVGPDGWP